VPVYRCYFLDGGNRIQGVEVLNAHDDAQALAMAERLFEQTGAPGVDGGERPRPVAQHPAPGA
jgi:hypothetical protein